MMNARAQGSMLYKDKKYREALVTIQDGLRKIKNFYSEFGQDEVYSQSNEVKVLRKFAREIRRKLPQDPIQKLQSQLQRAVKSERYEQAARLRDEIDMLKQRVGRSEGA